MDYKKIKWALAKIIFGFTKPNNYRNICKNLLKEVKTTKYLKYALGEIALVVIGILTDLQINN